MFQTWGADIINMSTAPEAILANEAGIPYAAIALCTDFDSWKEGGESVTWEAVLDIFNKNVEHVISLITKTLTLL
jgi:5'-methylthioadenosine phosphorylase